MSKKIIKLKIVTGILLGMCATMAIAEDTIVTNIFVAGEPALASDVNQNFTDLAAAIDAKALIAGPQGLAGEQGERGLQGLPGAIGSTGPAGANSTVAGPKGDTGAAGPKGDTGVAGAKGETGEVGLKGDIGETGPKGDTGEAGTPGTPGTVLPDGAVTGDIIVWDTDTTAYKTLPNPVPTNLPSGSVGNMLYYDEVNDSYIAGGKPSYTSPAVNNMQPYTAVNYIIALVGVFPSRSSADPLLGEISIFAGNFAPRGWAFADGQLLSISQNTALFSLIGTIYGGDGETTFALPDLRGRVPMHAGSTSGSGPGLTPRRIGERGGAESTTISIQ